jgi:ATP phosphoribosyltransferase regulatory subunit HisZ
MNSKDDATRYHIINTLTQRFQQAGYVWRDVPIVQDAELFLSRASDNIIERLYTFEHQGKTLALRPEFTAIAMREYIESGRRDVVRWQFSGVIFQTSSNSAPHERMSFGAELIGLDEPLADVEIIAQSIEGIRQLGIKKWHLVMGHVGLQRHLLANFGVNEAMLRQELSTHKPDVPTELPSISQEAQAAYILDRLLDSTPYGNTMGGRTRQDIAQRLLKRHTQHVSRETLAQAQAFLSAWSELVLTPFALDHLQTFLTPDDAQAQTFYTQWQSVLNALATQHGVPYDSVTIKPNLSRNWDYYTGLVFEIRAEDGTTLASGGRYNELGYVIGKKDDISAVGFTYYIENILQHLPQEGK